MQGPGGSPPLGDLLHAPYCVSSVTGHTQRSLKVKAGEQRGSLGASRAGAWPSHCRPHAVAVLPNFIVDI
eukprot:4409278-Alexandrium_andersonii.AAC.1